VCVAPEGGRMLATSARMADACVALLVGDTGFHTKGTGTATAGRMMSAIRMAESGDLAFPARPSTSWLQAPNASARCTRRGAYLSWQFLRERQMLVPRCSLVTLASIQKEQGRQQDDKNTNTESLRCGVSGPVSPSSQQGV